MENNLLHAIRHVYFHVVTKVLRILIKSTQCTQRAKRSENASSGRLQEVKKNRKSLSFQTQKVVAVGYRRYSLPEDPIVRSWLGKCWCFGLAVVFGRWSLTRLRWSLMEVRRYLLL